MQLGLGQGDRQFVYKRTMTSSKYLDAKHSVVPRAMNNDSPHGAFTAEVYVHDWPVESHGWKCFIAIPWVQQFVYGKDCHSRWICRHYPTWLEKLRQGPHSRVYVTHVRLAWQGGWAGFGPVWDRQPYGEAVHLMCNRGT